MAESVALAVFENLVHMSEQDFPNGYVCVAAVLPDSIMITTERDLRLRADLWELSPQALGDWWIQTKESAVLEVEVASAVVPHEHNYLLNPAHPEFAKIGTDPPALFHFDPRLFR
jgi:RES domain-containing protein